MPKVSVIVPVYNGEKYLNRCIDSILSQTFTSFELLLINDGSIDKSGVICDEYANKDPRIRVFYKENGGVSSARKIGIKSAKGDFLCFVDADDYFIDNDALNKLISAYKEGDDIIIAGYCDDIELSSTEYVCGLLENKIPWGVWSKLYKKSLFDENVSSIPEHFNIGEDLIMQLKLSHKIKGKIKCIKEDVYVLFNNPQSATHTRKYSIEYEQQFISEIYSIIQEYDVQYSLLRLRLNSLRMLIANGVKVSYNDLWVEKLKVDSMEYPTSLIDKIVLNKYYSKLYRLLFQVRRFNFFRK